MSGVPLVATASQTVGPFFSFGLTTNAALGRMAAADTPGERIRLAIRIVDGAGAAVPDAMVEVWHAAPGGACLFGRLETDPSGLCLFDTVYPGQVTKGANDAAHVNLCIFMRGLLRHLYTRAYFAGDAAIDSDAILAAVPPDRRDTLIARRDDAAPATWTFEIHLQGDRETVYFDL